MDAWMEDLEATSCEWPKKIPLAQMPALISRGMEVASQELTFDSDAKRRYLWTVYFSKLYRSSPNYQFQDFEIVDYGLHVIDDLGLFRSPRIDPNDLASGRFICLLGAAQFFGRFHRMPLHVRLGNALNIPVVNLAAGGAGPASYLEPKFSEYLSRAKITLVQVLSGRSVGCDEYPGGVKTRRKGNREPILRETLLREFIQSDPDEYVRLVHKWSALYCDYYRQLAALIPGRKLLVWMSERMPDGWSVEKGLSSGYLGRFPQMVTKEMVESIAVHFDGYVECVDRRKAPMTFKSRLTGNDCPFITNQGMPQWSTDYYPPESAHEHCFRLLEPITSKAL